MALRIGDTEPPPSGAIGLRESTGVDKPETVGAGFPNLEAFFREAMEILLAAGPTLLAVCGVLVDPWLQNGS